MRYQPKRDQYVTPSHFDDMEGNVRPFTHIDHDVKTLVGLDTESPPENWRQIQRKDLQERILGQPAVYCPLEFQDYTVRGEDVQVVSWNEKMIKDQGFEIHKLRDLTIILENRSGTIT